MREMESVVKAVGEIVRGHIQKAISPLLQKQRLLEDKLTAVPSIDVNQIIDSAAEKAHAKIEKPKDGEPGKDADPEYIKQQIEALFAGLPKPKDGEPGKSVTPDDVEPLLKQLVDAAVEKIPVPQDGKSISVEDVQKMIYLAVEKRVSEIEVRNGENGRDGADLEILPEIDSAKSYPRGTYATHNGGLWRSYQATADMKGWECIVDGVGSVDFSAHGERQYSVAITRSSGAVVAKEFIVPTMIYRGVYKSDDYKKGDAVTWAGSLWHCDMDTNTKPGESDHWSLCAKKGRDGRDGSNGKDFSKPTKMITPEGNSQ